MPVTIALVEWTGPIPRGLRASARIVSYRQALACLADGCSTLVLADRAIESLDPGEFRSAVPRLRPDILLCPSDCSYKRVTLWTRAGFVDVLPPTDLPNRLAAAPARSPLPTLALRDWLPPPLPRAGTAAERAIRRVPDLPALTVKCWAAALGCDRHALMRTCKDALDRPPSSVLRHYRDAVVRMVLGSSGSLVDAARRVGYSDASTLHRAYRREGRKPPRTGHQMRLF